MNLRITNMMNKNSKKKIIQMKMKIKLQNCIIKQNNLKMKIKINKIKLNNQYKNNKMTKT